MAVSYAPQYYIVDLYSFKEAPLSDFICINLNLYLFQEGPLLTEHVTTLPIFSKKTDPIFFHKNYP